MPPPLGKTVSVACELCGRENQALSYYEGFTCKHCGQDHVYDEGTNITLTDHQLNLLRRDKGLPEKQEG